jgi:hypothetical protein
MDLCQGEDGRRTVDLGELKRVLVRVPLKRLPPARRVRAGAT